MKLLSTISLVLLIAFYVQAAPAMEDSEEGMPSSRQLSFTSSNCSVDDIMRELNPNSETDGEAVR